MSTEQQPPNARGNWERKILEKVALSAIKEQRWSRRWNILFKVLFLAYLVFITVIILQSAKTTPQYDLFGETVEAESVDHIALVRLDGTIAASEPANAESLSATLRKAASKEHVKGLLIQANSPGGSPVQSSLVYKTIQEIKTRYNKPILTVVTDVCASGCYYIVSATDAIYADESSIVGSIGVISQSYGYADAAKKLGIDPRTYTAGDNKDFMNPARPMRPDEEAFLKKLLDELHQSFIQAVKAGRGDRLSDEPDESTLFSGLFWTGEQAQQLGLIDGIATPKAVAEKIGDYPVYDYAPKKALEKVLEGLGAETQRVTQKLTRQAVGNAVQDVLSPQNAVQFK